MQNNSFWKELWLLLICVFMGIGLLSVVVASIPMPSAVIQMHVTQWLQSVFVMFLPPLVWYRLRAGANPFEAFGFCTCNWKALLLTLVLMICSVPAVDFITVLSYTMPMPDAVRNLSLQMREESMVALERLLSVSGAGGMIELVLLMAVGTAIAEETMFRGAMVKCFGMTRLNHHWTALLVGLVFSLVHFDPLGFIPRWMLGTFFCYLLFWTGSLWTPILAHTINNMVALVQYKMAEGTGIETLMDQSEFLFPVPVMIVSIVVSALLVVCIRKMGVKSMQ